MGAKTWMIAYVDDASQNVLKSNPELDRAASLELAKILFPNDNLKEIENGDLSNTCPPDNEVYIGCYPGLNIIAAKEFALDYPSKLDRRFIDFGKGKKIYLHAMHSAVDWFAFAIWSNHKLERSLSLSPDSGILEDIGSKLPFEEPYWNGNKPVFESKDDKEEYPFCFHPLELGEEALSELFGYNLEGEMKSTNAEPENISVLHFKRSKKWWKF